MAKTALFYARMCPNLNCISIMMSFLTYIMGFFMNFELFADFDRLCKLGINKQKKSFKNLLVRNHLANFNQTLSE
jgi:hypothetical protein